MTQCEMYLILLFKHLGSFRLNLKAEFKLLLFKHSLLFPALKFELIPLDCEENTLTVTY